MSAALYAHGSISAAQAEQLCRSQGFELTRTTRGNFRLAPKPAARPEPRKGLALTPSPLITPAGAAGPDLPEAA